MLASGHYRYAATTMDLGSLEVDMIVVLSVKL